MQQQGVTRRTIAAGLGSVLAIGLVAFSGTGVAGATPIRHNGQVPHAGGSITALESSGTTGNWSAGLDPATNTDGEDVTEMDAIYGNLFSLGARGEIVPDLATSYSFSNGYKTANINLRRGVKFSDGSPFNAYAVRWNFERDLAASCTCKPTWPVASVTTPDGPNGYVVQVNLKSVYAPFISALIGSNANWIASPTALHKMGEAAFKVKPVGAGPFEVVSDVLSSQLVLKKNPLYWQKGRPYLDRLTFKSFGGGDQGTYEALLAGSAQVAEGIDTPSLLPEFKSHFTTTVEEPTSVYNIQMNTAIPPFNNILAREAIYYATNFAVINKAIFSGALTLSQSFTAPGGLFYEPKVPGYPTYDPAKARAIVKKLGGLSFNLFTVNDSMAITSDEALQKEWEAVGMKVSLSSYDLPSLIATFQKKSWEIALQTVGNYDPASGLGLAFRFSSTSPFSGVHDPFLDVLMNKSVSTPIMAKRAAYYRQIAEYIAKKFYGPFLGAFGSYDAADHGICGPGLSSPIPVTVIAVIPWQDISAHCS